MKGNFFKVAMSALLIGLLPALSQAAPTQPDASAAMVRNALQAMVKKGEIIGGAAALYKDGKSQIVTVGRKDIKGDAPDENTLFSIGSITKVFTAAMLARLINEGKVKLDEPVDKYLPSYTHLRSGVKGKLTFERLATFTASLPDGTPPKIKTAKQYFGSYLSKWSPRWPIGSKDKYSDQSYEILAYVVPRIGRTDYRHMLSDLITGPLGMSDTLPITASNPDTNRAYGYGSNGKKSSYHRDSWDGVGFLFSTPANMLSLLEACLGAKTGGAGLQQALELSWKPYFRMSSSSSQGFAWVIHHVKAGETHELISKNGATAGFNALIVLDRDNKSGIVFMVNRDAKKSKHAPGFFGLARKVLTGR